MNLTYHNEVVGNIRMSKIEDCSVIAENIRKQDAVEMWNFYRISPLECIRRSFNRSIISMTIEHGNVPIVMFGIIPHDMSSGMIWMITTDGIKNIGRVFVRNCKKWFQAMLEFYPKLYGMVDLRNTESIRWLTYIGVSWGNDITAGADNMPFKTFKFSKE